jgi:tetrapyrrole methylase family protein/MazG family protein
MPAGITIIGLGPGPSEQWTLAARRLLHAAPAVYLRTAHHPSVADIPAPRCPFEATAAPEAIAAEIVRLGRDEAGVLYAVPGHPGWGEATVPLIRVLAAAEKLPVTIVPGLSLMEATLTALGLDVPGNLQLAEAPQLAGPFRYHPPLEPDRPALITHLTDAALAGAVGRSLRHILSRRCGGGPGAKSGPSHRAGVARAAASA